MSEGATRLFFIRHAETEWNTARIFQGHLDSTLTPRGLSQAEALAARLAMEPIRTLYSSDQGRAVQTARPLVTRLGLDILPRPDLREIQCGEWTGRSFEEVSSLWPEEYSTWRQRPEAHRMPGGESHQEVLQRGLAFLDDVRQRHPGQTVCAITHNTVVRAVLCHLRGWPLSRLWEGERQPNCALNLIELANSRIELSTISDSSHLATVGGTGFSPTV